MFYAPDIALTPELPQEEAQHCARVLRLKTGDLITVTDGKGMFYQAILTEAHPKRCRLRIVERREQKPLWRFHVHIAVAPVKNTDRMEWFVEKATEIGINKITCLRCRYSERREINMQRLHKIAVSAMKQSQQAWLPDICTIVDFHALIASVQEDCRMIGHCAGGERRRIGEVYRTGESALILIGPEGDFSADEIAAALAAGFHPVSLGENRLRTETAALAACHTIHVLNQ